MEKFRKNCAVWFSGFRMTRITKDRLRFDWKVYSLKITRFCSGFVLIVSNRIIQIGLQLSIWKLKKLQLQEIKNELKIWEYLVKSCF